MFTAHSTFETMVEYHSTDFDVKAWADEVSLLYKLPELSEYMECRVADTSSSLNSMYSEKWNTFYSNHTSGKFFKPRRYLTVEFQNYLQAYGSGSTVVEVGCGHGCSMFPIIESYQMNYIATDCAAEVLPILESNSKFNPERCAGGLWDVTEPAPEQLLSLIRNPVLAVIAVFALSAVHPDKHVQSLINMRSILSNMPRSGDEDSKTGVILFRDYGIHDMTMYRHKKRYSDRLFGRADGTLAYYFDVDYMRSIAAAAGLHVVELEYATVRTENRKANSVMHRVFVHAVLSIHSPQDGINSTEPTL